MIHLNLKPDLETALRKLSAQNGYPRTTICAALMHRGLASGVKKIEAACASPSRPMGRPITDVPDLAQPARKLAQKSDDSPLTPEERREIEYYLIKHPKAQVNIAKWRAENPQKPKDTLKDLGWGKKLPKPK